MRIQRILFACLVLTAPVVASAANHLLPDGGEVLIPGGPPGFVVLRQPQASQDIILDVRPTPATAGLAPGAWQWERWQPNGGGYTEVRHVDWAATASCSAGIDWIRIEGPGGSQTQTFNGSRNAISGRTTYDSFDPDALDAVCLAWGQDWGIRCANQPTANADCDTEVVFTFDRRNPVPGNAPVQVTGQCEDGAMEPEEYVRRLDLTCRFSN